MIDAGSTAIAFCEMLRENFKKLTIVTHSEDVFRTLSAGTAFEIYLTGGQYQKEEKAFYGFLASDFLRQFHVPKAFLFPSSILLKEGIGDFCAPLVEMQKVMMGQAEQVFFLADSNKFQTSAPIRVCSLSTSDIYLTDRNLPEELAEQYRKKAFRLL